MGLFLVPVALSIAFALQPTGAFHADEPVARNGEAWLALVDDARGMRLVATHARVAQVHDPIVDAEGEASGLEVAAPAAPDAVMLMRGPDLRAGAVEAAQRLEPRPDELSALRFRGAHYRLRLRCPPRPPARGASDACQLVLAGAGREQALADIPRWRGEDGTVGIGDAADPGLLHAGDFDRDGRLDLILDATDHYNVSEPRLFLSSQARAGELLRAVASHRSVGC